MTFEKKVVFISSSHRQSKGNTYHSVTVEDVESGEIYTFPSDEHVADGVKKYESYGCVFGYTEYKGDGRIRVMQFTAANSGTKQSQ